MNFFFFINKTPLHFSIINNKLDIFKKKIQNKFLDLNLKDEEGKKPEDYCLNEEFKQFFLKKNNKKC